MALNGIWQTLCLAQGHKTSCMFSLSVQSLSCMPVMQYNWFRAEVERLPGFQVGSPWFRPLWAINKLSILKVPPEGPVVLPTLLCESVRLLIQELILLSQTGCYCYEWNAVKWIMGVSEGRAELWGLFFFCLEQTAQNIYNWEAGISSSKEPFLLFRAVEKVFRVYTD